MNRKLSPFVLSILFLSFYFWLIWYLKNCSWKDIFFVLVHNYKQRGEHLPPYITLGSYVRDLSRSCNNCWAKDGYNLACPSCYIFTVTPQYYSVLVCGSETGSEVKKVSKGSTPHHWSCGFYIFVSAISSLKDSQHLLYTPNL